MTYPELAGLVCFFDEIGIPGMCYTLDHFSKGLLLGALCLWATFWLPGLFDWLARRFGWYRLTGAADPGCAEPSE